MKMSWRVVSLSVMVGLLVVGLSGASYAQTYYTINLQAQSGHYVVAESGGGDYVNANRTSPGAWETFELEDIDGGSLLSGDIVFIRTSGGYYFSSPCNSPVSHLRAMATFTTNCPMMFWMEKYDAADNYLSGSINSGDQVAFTHWNYYYLSAENGGGDIVSHNRSSVGAWERFFISY
jgi:hypothetical protein